MNRKASVYGPWINRRGNYFPVAPPGIVMLRHLGMMPLVPRRPPEPEKKNQSKG